MSFARLPVVHLEGGALKEFPGEPAPEALARLTKAHKEVYLVDADGLRANKADLDLIRDSSRNASLWVDGGSRYATDVMDLFVAGAERVTARWNTLHSMAELEEAASFSEDLFLGIEFRHGFIDNKRDPAGTPEALFRRVEELGIGLVVIDLLAATATQVDQNLARTGARFRGTKWYAGGRGGAYDLESLESLAYSGILLPASALPGGGSR